MAVGHGGTIVTTTDPAGTWTPATNSGTPQVFQGVAYGNGRWVAVGHGGTIVTTTDPAGTWTPANSGTSEVFDNVAYGNGRWVAVGEGGTIVTTTDPTGTWEGATSGISEWLYGVAYANGQWVAVGGDRTIVTAPIAVDVDVDNDGLIEINYLEDLDDVRRDLAGTSASGSTFGAPTSPTANCDTDSDGDGAYLCGYELARSLDFDEAASYRSGGVNTAWTNGAGPNTGWTPIGGSFNAIFDGNGHTIGDLRIARQDTTRIGLFGTIGSSGEIRDLALSNARVSYTGSGSAIDIVGGLVGNNRGTITASYATGMVDGGDGDRDRVGGLVGNNGGGTITASYAIGAVGGGDGATDLVGGLVGVNESGGTITASYAIGDVDGGAGNNDRVGGLVGQNIGTITASYATGAADGGAGDEDRVGGLVGRNDGTITASYASGAADGGAGDDDSVGGLVGYNVNSGTSTASYGFGTKAGGEDSSEAVDRSDDASPAGTVANAAAITQANSSDTGTDWSDSVWDFGTVNQRPVLKWVTASDFTCDPTLLPSGQSCGGIIPGQDDRDVFDGAFNRVGGATQFGVNEDFPQDLAAIGNTLYMVGAGTDALYTVDTTSGRATRVGGATQFGVNEGTPIGLAAIGDTLYMVGRETDALHTVDTASGRATRVGGATDFWRGRRQPPRSRRHRQHAVYGGGGN